MHIHEQPSNLHSDLTGALPNIGFNTSIYIVIFFCEENNYIHAIDVTSRWGPILLATLQSAIKFFASHVVEIRSILRLTLADLGYPQTQKSTTIICDNECAVGIANDSFYAKTI